VSEENVEIVRSLLARWERGDYDTEAFDPEVSATSTAGTSGCATAGSCAGMSTGSPPRRGGRWGSRS